MSSVAIFVDAGYLFAQGSTALTGSKKPRAVLRLNETAAIAELTSIASRKCASVPLLRIYWYDGARGNRGLAMEHATLAYTDYVKLRLGLMNSQGQQKGVDSLIITDLIELARNQAMTDAVLLSGDEDVRVGVQIAQSFGVRVHLLGIAPCRGSQSPQLMQEADTTTEWDASTVGKFLSVAPAAVTAPLTLPILAAAAVISAAIQTPPTTEAEVVDAFDRVVSALLASLDSNEITALHSFWTTNRGLPPEIDGRLLARCRAEIGRDLLTHEKRLVRSKFTTRVQGGP